MTAKTAEQVVRETYDAVERTGSIDEFLKTFADDAVLEESAWLPYAGSYRGKAAIKQAVEQIMTHHWRDFDARVNSYTADAELVSVDLTLTATGNKTGKRVSFTVLELWRVENGKVTWVRPIYGDYAKVREALDLA